MVDPTPPSVFALAALLIMMFMSGCGKPAVLVSPDGTSEIRPEVHDSLVHLVVTDRARTVQFRQNTKASDVQRWSFQWITDSKILFRSSDIGPSEWLKQPDGSWERVNPLKKLSPNKKLVLYTWWHEGRKLAIDLLRADGDVDTAISLQAEFHTDIVVPDLVDVGTWDGNDTFRIRTGGLDAVWKRQAGDSWARVQ